MAKVKKPKAKPAAKAKAPKEIDYRSPEYLAAYDAETAKLTGSSGTEVGRLKLAFEALHEEASLAKKEFESARTKHFQIIRERIDGRGKKPGHLFAQAEAEEVLSNAPGAKAKAKAKGKATAAKAPPVKGNPPGSENSWYPVDLWKKYPLERLTSLGLKSDDVGKLAAGELKGGDTCPITTVGDVEAFQAIQASGKGRKLTEVKGVGPDAAKRIVKAVNAFWGDWPTLAETFAVEEGFKRPLSENDGNPTTIPFGTNGEYEKVIDRATAGAM